MSHWPNNNRIRLLLLLLPVVAVCLLAPDRGMFADVPEILPNPVGGQPFVPETSAPPTPPEPSPTSVPLTSPLTSINPPPAAEDVPAVSKKEARKARQKAKREARRNKNHAPETEEATAPPNQSAPVDQTDGDAGTAASEKKLDQPVSPKPIPEDIAQKYAQLGPEARQGLERLTEALHREHRAIQNELRDDEELALTDITLLWQAAIERSGTIRFAIEKLSRQDATGQPVSGPSFTKRLIHSTTNLIGVGTSIWTGTPAGLLGGGLVDELMNGDPTVSAMSRVTDADMLLLAKEVESLQSQVIEGYYAYRHAEEQWKLAQEFKHSLSRYAEAVPAQAAQEGATGETPPDAATAVLQPILESLYEGVRQEERTARQKFVSTRNALGLLVGAEALLALEQARQEGATTKKRSSGVTEGP